MPKLNEKILFVDDDENILLSYQRQLRKTAHIYTASSGAEGLKIVEKEGPFAVIISDMRMPSMNGAEFLAKAKTISPDSVRIVLTGQADIESAVEAINNGQIFRFLSKPCPPPMMAEALISGISQYRLLTAESELLERTLKGSIKVLTEVLSMANPMIFRQENRFKYYVRELVTKLKIENSWDIEVAAMLSNLGYITLNEELILKIARHDELTDEERAQVKETYGICVKLISNIPRMDNVTGIIEAQHMPFALIVPTDKLTSQQRIGLCGHILKIAKHVDYQLSHDQPIEEIVHQMVKNDSEFDPAVAKQLLFIKPLESHETILVTVSQLNKGMVIDQDIRHKNGALLISVGHEVNEATILHLSNHAARGNFKQPFRVRTSSVKNVSPELLRHGEG